MEGTSVEQRQEVAPPVLRAELILNTLRTQIIFLSLHISPLLPDFAQHTSSHVGSPLWMFEELH